MTLGLDYERIGLALAEMLDRAYTEEWIAYLMNMLSVPSHFDRPKRGKIRSKYTFCKDLFRELQRDATTREIIVDFARYIVQSEHFDPKLRDEGEKHLPIFKMFISRAGFVLPPDNSMSVMPMFSGRSFTPDPHMCFVLMPFTKTWSDRIYNKILRPILLKANLEPRRADDMFGHDIMDDIWSALNAAFVVIADLTGRNPNVFYELGLAHTLGKNVILMTQNEKDVPFDVARLRYIKYSDDADGYEKLETALPQFIDQFRCTRHT